jgi:hypothetical protein
VRNDSAVAIGGLTAALILVLNTSTSYSDEAGLTCSAPFRKGIVILCGIKRCQPAGNTYLIDTAEHLPVGQTSYRGVVKVAVIKGRKPTAVFISSSIKKLFEAGYLRVRVQASGTSDSVAVSALSTSSDNRPFALKLCILYGS